MDYLRYLDPRPQSPIDWFALLSVLVVVGVIFAHPHLNKVHRLFWSGISCLAFGTAGLLFKHNPKIGGAAFAAIGMVLICVSIKMLLARSAPFLVLGEAGTLLPTPKARRLETAPAPTVQLLPDSVPMHRQLKEVNHRD